MHKLIKSNKKALNRAIFEAVKKTLKNQTVYELLDSQEVDTDSALPQNLKEYDKECQLLEKDFDIYMKQIIRRISDIL